MPRLGKRYRSSAVVFGLPLVDVAFGLDENGKPGRAKGIIALGDNALGWLAIGGFARGLIAIGGFALGVIGIGGLGIGIFALGGGALGVIATGGGAAGGVAFGGAAAGFSATGGGAVGYYARGGGAYGKYVLMPSRRDSEAARLFSDLDAWLMAPSYQPSQWWRMVGMFAFGWLMVLAAIAVPAALLVLLSLWQQRRARVRSTVW